MGLFKSVCARSISQDGRRQKQETFQGKEGNQKEDRGPILKKGLV